MHTIALSTQKGGSGKSTLAIGLALAAIQNGLSVRLLDTDPQGTLVNWQRRRTDGTTIVDFANNAGEIAQKLQEFERSGVTLTIIDTAGGFTATTAAAVRSADLCLIPVRPSVADIEAAASTLSLIRSSHKPFAFVLNQTPVRGQRINNAAVTLGDEAALDAAGVLASPYIVMRNDHQDALGAGLAVSEFAPGGKSAEEIGGLWRWVEERLTAAARSQVQQFLSEFQVEPEPAVYEPAPDDSVAVAIGPDVAAGTT